jgi:nucleoid-associated protein YgaU
MNRYLNIVNNKTEEGRRYIQNAIYPDIPESANDIYVIVTVGDRYDTLAQSFYGDTSLWWIIASANPSSKSDSLVPTPGTQIRIPANEDRIISAYERLNKRR